MTQDLPSGAKSYADAYAQTPGLPFTPAEVGALLDPADRPTPPPPVTVDQAMTAVLHLARKLDVTTGQPLELEDLADLTERLAAAVRTRAHVMSAQVVAEQHGQLTTERGRVAAAASAQTLRDARIASDAAYQRLAEAIAVYGQR